MQACLNSITEGRTQHVQHKYIFTQERGSKPSVNPKDYMYKVYSKPDCPYCIKAKDLLNRKGIAHEVIEVGKDISSEEYRSMIPGWTTVPAIYDSWGVFIGGYQELTARF